MKKIVLLFSLLFVFNNISAQETSQKISSKKYVKSLTSFYATEINLSSEKKEKLFNIILETNRQLGVLKGKLSKEQKSQFNQTTKEEFIKIYNLLSPDELLIYKKLSKEKEPYKAFKS